MARFKYFDIRHQFTDYPDAKYYIAIGERSNGKTYSSLDYALERFAKNGEEFGYLRRWGEDIRPKNLSTLFDSHIENGRIAELFPGYNSIEYSSNRFSICYRESGRKDPNIETKVIGRAFDLNGMEHYKSISFPRITTVIYDEFMSREGYLPNEFQLFQNALSTIIRQRDNVRVIMLGNTVNQYCPLFDEMGLKHVKNMKPGTVDVYQYGDTGLKVVMEYCESAKKHGGKASDVYFAFDNPQLKMITEGTWEIGVYPHLPVPYKPKDVVADFFVDFSREILHGKVISVGDEAPFVFLHKKTTDIQREDDIVYTTIPDANPYHRYGLLKQKDALSVFIKTAINEGRIFYATNEAGETFRNFLMWNKRRLS